MAFFFFTQTTSRPCDFSQFQPPDLVSNISETTARSSRSGRSHHVRSFDLDQPATRSGSLTRSLSVLKQIYVQIGRHRFISAPMFVQIQRSSSLFFFLALSGNGAF